MKTRLFFGLFVLFALAGAWVVLPEKAVSAEPASSKLSSPVRVSAGFAHTCALDSSGSISCWGDNRYGQNDVPAPNAGFIEVSAGWYHTCALRDNYSIACWGSNNRVQATVPALPAERHFTAVSAGGYHSCGLVDDGAIICWGENSLGQRNVPEPYTGFTAVSAGWYHTCALKEEGTPICWGFNYWGQATPAPGLYTQISAGGYMSCGLTMAGEIRCWGNTVPGDSYGEVTDAPTTGGWTQVDSGMQHSCALRTDGSITCWGWDSSHQVSVRPEDNLNMSVSAGYEHTCALRTSGTITCWGSNVAGQAPVLSINQVGLPAASYMTSYSATLTGSGGSEGPYTFSITAGSLPAGLQLSLDGVINGSPSEMGSFYFDVLILDANRISGVSHNMIEVGAVSTTTTLSSDANPAVVGQPVKFTATVQPVTGLGIPSGEISFYDGPNELARRVLVNGQASFQTTYPTVGNHSITVQYHGHHAGAFTASVSDPLAQQVNKAGTTLTVTPNAPSPAVWGQIVTFTARVAAQAPGSGTPGGSVTFFLNGAPVGAPQALVNGAASWSIDSLEVATHEITAVYAESSNFTGGSAATLPFVVEKAPVEISVSTSKNPIVYGEPVTLIATVRAQAPGAGAPTGTVTFQAFAVPLGERALAGGSASLTTSNLDRGAAQINVAYGGDNHFRASTGRLDQIQQVHLGSVTVLVTSSPNPSLYGQPVTFTATVAAAAPSTRLPGGTVRFLSDGSISVPIALDGSGAATFTTGSLSASPTPHIIYALYRDGGGYADQDVTLSGGQQVEKAGTSLQVTANWSTKPAAPVYRQPVTLTATVRAAAPGAGTPSGSVVFTVGGEEQAAGLSGGAATFTLTDLPVGNITVSAAYAGDDNFNGAGDALAGGLEVGKAGTSVSLTSSKNPAAFGEAVGFTATVSVTAPGSGTPEGTLEFYNGSDLIGSGALVAGQHAVTISTLALDGSPHAIHAVYMGSGSYHGSNSTDLSQQIGDADLAAQIRADSSEVLPGGGFTYTLTVENHGILTATGVTATVTLPPQVVQTDMPAGCAATENVLTCVLLDLAAGGQESLALPVCVPEQTPGGTQLVVRGGVQSAVYDRNAANNSVEELRIRVLAPPINYYLPLIFVW